jgi:hypothetical protein
MRLFAEQVMPELKRAARAPAVAAS